MSKRTEGKPRIKAKKIAWKAKRAARRSWITNAARRFPPIVLPWANAEHARERERHLRQMGRAK